VLAWLREPTGDISSEAQTALTAYSAIRDLLFPESVRRAVTQLVWEVRWDGPRNEFTVMLDEIAVAEVHVSITRRDDETQPRSRPCRETPKRGASR